ncbi:hypothetical protein D3C72_776340 [compost metagenome]
MNLQMLVESVDETVIRIGQVAVGGEARGSGSAEEHFETRVLADLEAPTEGVRT